MIRITRPAEPNILQTKGKEAVEKLKSDFDNGVTKFDIDNNIYAAKSVKESLRNAQHEKCCFCERKEEVGDIEHFRPKSHYYWLAYDWENLLFCCPTCNRSYKRTNFPIAIEKNRANSHHDNILEEEPLLINPYLENPEDFIAYKGVTICAVKNNQKGETTIDEIGLNRPFLDGRKIDIYNSCKTLYKAIQQIDNEILKIELSELLNKASLSSSEYSLMIRCAMNDNFKY